MSIEPIVLRSRLYSCLSTDPKPDGWAPGILLLELDTGVWWYTNETSEWNACYPTMTRHQALMDRAAALELDGEAKAVTIATMQARITAMQRDMSALKNATAR